MSYETLIRDYMQAWNDHNPQAAGEFLAEDVTFYDASIGTPLEGRANVRDNGIALFIGAVPDVKWEMTSSPIVGPDGIAYQWRFSGTNTGAWDENTPATGKAFAFEGATFIRIKNGKIAYQGDYYDALNFHKQLGWL
ncbi:ester cyclase [Neisseria lisongii]|uniref:Ester cyclase n=1 Tax=Neisseria lisongii TaxID=2912188 RepID=A0AAW5AHJ7_9NEIS|nr:ester cyclase [Neisseria lisongii]MCF7529297.1 ester cyclase [Neisseria lisongii]